MQCTYDNQGVDNDMFISNLIVAYNCTHAFYIEILTSNLVVEYNHTHNFCTKIVTSNHDLKLRFLCKKCVVTYTTIGVYWYLPQVHSTKKKPF